MPSHIEYTKEYASQSLKGRDITARPQLAADIAVNYGGKNKRLLDIGCGSAYKTIPLTTSFAEIIGLDPSTDLLTIAQNQIRDQKISNFQLMNGIAASLPFSENSFDVSVSILSWWVPSEISRILKQDGCLLIECLGSEDKKTFTQYFGRDQKGWRGANLNTNLAAIQSLYQQQLSPFFNAIDFLNVSWQTAYSEQGLWLLLNNTQSTVRNFDPVEDKKQFDIAIAELKVNEQIILTQNRLVIVARK